MSNLAPKSWNRTAVRCLAGFKANESPLSFLLDESEIEVRAILESWRETDYLYVKVGTEDGGIYDLRCHEYEDFWQVREASQQR